MLILYIYTGGQGPVAGWDIDSFDGETVVVSGYIEDRQIKNGYLKIYLENAELSLFQENFEDNKISYYSDTVCLNNGEENYNRVEYSANDYVEAEGLILQFNDYSDIYDLLKLGSKIRVKGVFTPFDRVSNEGEFDLRSYYKIRGYDGQIKKASLLGASRSYDGLSEGLRKLRDRAELVIASYLDENYASVLNAMILGDKSGLEADTKDLYQKAGISHVLALSGLHIASIGLLVLKLLKKLTHSLFVSSLLSSLVIIAYCIMTGMSVSSIRAMIMFIMSVMAMTIGRSYDLITAASFSAICILIGKPSYLYDSSFLLSFGAVTGIACIFPVIDVMTSITDSENRLFIYADNVRKSICISLSITLATLPISAYSFFQIPLFSVLLNLIVIPLMSLLLMSGILGIILGMVIAVVMNCGAIEESMNGICSIIFGITRVILKVFEGLAGVVAGIKGNILIIGRPSLWQCIIYYIMILALVIYLSSKYVNPADNAVDPHGRTKWSHLGSEVTKRHGQAILTGRKSNTCIRRIKAIVLSTIYIIFAYVILSYHPKGILEIRNLYVGQGDCTIIYGRDLPTIMIDGGSSDIKQVGKYKILPVIKSNGISSIDYCFLTHMDKDHISGVMEILEDPTSGVVIKNLIVSKSFIRSNYENQSSGQDSNSRSTQKDEASSYDYNADNKDTYEQLISLAGVSRFNLLTMGYNDELRIRGLDIKCLSPKKDRTYDGNDSSLVLLLSYYNNEDDDTMPEYIFKALFPGDISSYIESELLTQLPMENCLEGDYPQKDYLKEDYLKEDYLKEDYLNEDYLNEDYLKVDYLKVAHHGSRYSTSNDFLLATNPKFAVISSGIDNSYGHPHKETIERLESKGVKYYNTAESGEIICIINDNMGKGMRVERPFEL